MRIIKTPPIIFVHVPKAAGSSISHALDTLGAVAPYYTHSSAIEIQEKVGARAWAASATLAAIRNPYDQRASQWCELNRNVEIASRLKDKWPGGFEEWILWLGNAEPNPWDTQEEIPYLYLTNRPQSYYLKDSKGSLMVKTILCYETIAEDFARFCIEHKLRSPALPHINASHKKIHGNPSVSYKTWYTDQMKKSMLKIYHEDFETFGYSA